MDAGSSALYVERMMHRTFATLALGAILLGSVALPCYAAASAMARDAAASVAPCDDAGHESSTILCSVPGTSAPPGVAPVGASAAPLQALAADEWPAQPETNRIAVRNPRDSTRPPTAPLFLLHTALLI